ncbi:MAG: chemotaxis protein CheA [Planctomycetia bacterium]|nr:chemotaxis protein CheA [Planctomycetia bacterium]
MTDNREFIEEFLVESSENLDQLDQDLIALEKQPDDAQRVASIFRTVHTIKGNSGFFGFSKLGALAHSGEHLLGRLRDGKLTLDDRVTGSLYSMVDAVRSILQAIETTGNEGDQDYRDLSRALAAAAEQTPISTSPSPVTQESPAVPEPRAAAPAAAVPAATPPPAQPIPPVQPTAAAPVATAETTVRVDVDLLASILDLVGELVLARNQLRSLDSDDPAVQAVAQRINTVTNALQETAVKTRMQPVEHVFNRFPRTVRDVAASCGKEVELVIDGADTELDRTLIESIRDPLTHLIRNSVDHGIEPPDVRVASGKPRVGRLSLRAFNESGRVTIEVADDGGGIAFEKVREKAVARGLVSAAEAAAMPPDQVLQFIFEPGFSTAATVTSVSGRGVGMDVVRTNIEAIGGTVDIQSTAGIGTVISVHVPLTLAIMPALVVRCGSERFAIPQSAVGELVPLKRDRSGPRIEGLAEAPVMRVRGRLVPIVFLDQFLGIRETTACREDGTVVLVRVDDREFGLVVDGMQSSAGHLRCRELLDAASLSTIVVKPIGGLLTALGLYTGATVLGDGGVVLILDLRGLLRILRLPPVDREPDAAPIPIVEITDRYLVCGTLGGRRVAVPLADVVRLETFHRDEVEVVGHRRVVRRGDGFTTLEDADELLGCVSTTSPPTVNVVVVGGSQGGFGLAVGSIIDVLAAESRLQPTTSPGVAGILALGGVATEVIDLDTAVGDA